MTDDHRPPCILCDTPTESIGEWEGVNYCLRHAALSYYFVPEATGMTRGSSELLEYLNELKDLRQREKHRTAEQKAYPDPVLDALRAVGLAD